MLAAGAAVSPHRVAHQGVRGFRQRQRAARRRRFSSSPAASSSRAWGAASAIGRGRFTVGPTLGLAYSIFLTDAAIAPAFPSNTRGAASCSDRPVSRQGAGLDTEDDKSRRLGGYLMFCGIDESFGVVGALAHGVLGEPDRRRDRAAVRPDCQLRLLADGRVCVPALAAILLLPLRLYRLFPRAYCVERDADAPAAAREALRTMDR
jgi:DASS family divalent anion:Na+ symporter